ncbi:MAG: lipopolysaccharide biosynthesis protein, partial [Gemmatimonadota bacterium]
MSRETTFQDPRTEELDTRIMRSSAWAFVGYGGANALALVTTLVLARLLVPEDFGIVALSLSLLAVAQIVQDSGLAASLIVHRGDMRRAAATVLVFSPLVATGLYAVFFAAAPLAAAFFDEPRLTDVLRVMALVLVLRGLTVMPVALLERQMRFGPITAIELGSGIAQASTAIALAFAGAGLWSLVGGQLALGVARVLLSWCFAPLRPSPFEASRETLRELVRFGRHVGAANLINYGNANSQGIVIGRVLGTTALGYYTIASRLALMPVSVIGNVLGRGVFAALSRVADDPVRFRGIWLDNIKRVALLAAPAAIGLALVAEPLVLTLLGDDWERAIVPLQILALNSAVSAFSGTSGEVFQALGRPKLRVAGEAVYLTLIVPALVIGANRHGIVGAAAAVILVNTAVGIGLLTFIVRLLRVRPAELAHAVLRPALGWGLMAASMLALRPVVDDKDSAIALVGLVVLGAGVYALIVTLFARDLLVTMWVS